MSPVLFFHTVKCYSNHWKSGCSTSFNEQQGQKKNLYLMCFCYLSSLFKTHPHFYQEKTETLQQYLFFFLTVKFSSKKLEQGCSFFPHGPLLPTALQHTMGAWNLFHLVQQALCLDVCKDRANSAFPHPSSHYKSPIQKVQSLSS